MADPKTPYKGEKELENSKTRQRWKYIDEELKIDQISRELNKTTGEVIHYPRGFEGGAKYKNIEQFIFKGFKEKGLPVGVYKSVNYGWGFTKPMNPLSNFIDSTLELKKVIICKDCENKIDNRARSITLNEETLSNFYTSFKTIYAKNKAEVENLLHNLLHGVYPKKVEKPKVSYIKNGLANAINSWGNSINEFSDDDKSAITNLFDKLSSTTDFLTKSALSKSKELIDIKYIQQTIKEFDKLLKAKVDSPTLEKKWQKLLKENSWIFSTIFAQPVILYKDEAYVGGKSVKNKDGKFNDFLIKNDLSDNVSFLEIKTHHTKLVSSKPYRGTDVFSIEKEVTGCVVQVLNQRDNFQKEFYALKAKAKKGEYFESFNPQCVILIGSLSNLSDEQKSAFEMYRSNSRDVTIITFDELFSKIRGLQSIMKK